MNLYNKSIADVIKKEKLIKMINDVGINTLEELCSYSPKRLIEKEIESLYVKDISIALQCEGLDLKKKVKNRKLYSISFVNLRGGECLK